MTEHTYVSLVCGMRNLSLDRQFMNDSGWWVKIGQTGLMVENRSDWADD